jgi:magnesium chelatase family protein
VLTRTFTAAISGLTPIKIEVEIDSNRGTPNLIIIGLPTKAVEESKERITSALINCGVRIRSRRTIVNLAPADIRKSSPSFELAIAVGMLKMYGEIKIDTNQTIFFGELSLDGDLKPIKGALPLIIAARQMGFKKVVLPVANIEEVSIISGITIHPLNNLKEYLSFIRDDQPLPVLAPQKFKVIKSQTSPLDFKDIYGQDYAKRALEIAATGGHNVLLIGPPGAGKSILAKTIISILPPLSEAEAIEVTTIYSIYAKKLTGLLTQRPFRNPHHTASYAGLLGGGRYLRPGEVSLAHRGVLFLDEFTEFDKYTLESLRQPIEDKKITIVRAHGSVSYPAAFTLIAAANPCACGWHGSKQKLCRCSQFALDQYQNRFSGPLLDRIDLFIRVKAVDINLLANSKTKQLSSKDMGYRVMSAKKFQSSFLKSLNCFSNSELSTTHIKQRVRMSSQSKNLLNMAISKFNLTARGYFRLIRVAQTIAHLDQSHKIKKHHLAEALQYRQDNLA